MVPFGLMKTARSVPSEVSTRKPVTPAPVEPVAPVDPVLPRFAADLDTMKNAGHTVERYNLSQQPQAFIDNKEIHALISTKGTDVLPVVVVDGHVVSKGLYPSMEMLQMWTAGRVTAAAASVATLSLPIADQGCCSGSTGCC